MSNLPIVSDGASFTRSVAHGCPDARPSRVEGGGVSSGRGRFLPKDSFQWQHSTLSAVVVFEMRLDLCEAGKRLLFGGDAAFVDAGTGQPEWIKSIRRLDVEFADAALALPASLNAMVAIGIQERLQVIACA